VISHTKSWLKIRNRFVVALGLVLVACALYVLSAIAVSVLVKRHVIPTPSPTLRLLMRFYAPLFEVMEKIPGADDQFTAVTSWLAGSERDE
jgi:hypothetical protein